MRSTRVSVNACFGAVNSSANNGGTGESLFTWQQFAFRCQGYSLVTQLILNRFNGQLSERLQFFFTICRGNCSRSSQIRVKIHSTRTADFCLEQPSPYVWNSIVICLHVVRTSFALNRKWFSFLNNRTWNSSGTQAVVGDQTFDKDAQGI